MLSIDAEWQILIIPKVFVTLSVMRIRHNLTSLLLFHGTSLHGSATQEGIKRKRAPFLSFLSIIRTGTSTHAYIIIYMSTALS